MSNEAYRSLRQLLDEVIKRNCKKQSTLMIGIDGCGGSGKSTLADKINNFLDVTIVHIDDFYLPSSLIMKIEPTK